MFERNRIDTRAEAMAQTGVAVEITTDDGARLNGTLLIGQGKGLVEALNGTGGFVEFEPFGGERGFLAKTALRHVRLIQAPRPANLPARARGLDDLDPHGVLGVPADAAFETVKAAWHRLAKEYHPDRTAGVELPKEVRDYIGQMAKRINAAFAALEANEMQARRLAAGRSTPIYTSQPRV